MFVLGLLLLVVSGAVALGVVLDNTEPTSVTAFGLTVSNINLGGLFLAGAVVGLVFMLGLAMMVAGASRRRARRVAARREVRDVRSEREQLAEENAALKARLGEPYPDGDGSPAYPADETARHAKHGVFRR